MTPLQLATVYAAIANGGKVLEPHVARALVLAGRRGARDRAGRAARRCRPIPELLDYVRDALAGVTQPGGTAAGAFAGAPVAVAGKTGTGEVAGKQDTSWFASFAPAEAPELVVVGMVSQGGTGGTVAAPMVREVYDGIYGPGGLPGGSCRALPAVAADGSRRMTVLTPVRLGRRDAGLRERAPGRDSPLRRLDWVLALAVAGARRPGLAARLVGHPPAHARRRPRPARPSSSATCSTPSSA